MSWTSVISLLSVALSHLSFSLKPLFLLIVSILEDFSHSQLLACLTLFFQFHDTSLWRTYFWLPRLLFSHSQQDYLTLCCQNFLSVSLPSLWSPLLSQCLSKESYPTTLSDCFLRALAFPSLAVTYILRNDCVLLGFLHSPSSFTKTFCVSIISSFREWKCLA